MRFWPIFLAAAFSPAAALDLGEAYRLAQEADAKYQSVVARTEAEIEGVTVARAKLLPQVGAVGSVGKLWVERKAGGRNFPVSPTDTWNWAVNLRQPLYRPGEWAIYRQARASAEGAQFRLQNEKSLLLERLAKAYLAALNAAAQLQTAQSDVARYQAILHQAEAAFYRGQGTRIEIEEAKARRDAAYAQVLSAQGELEIAERALILLIGKQVSSAELKDLAERHILSRDILARPPTSWVDEAKSANLGLAFLRKQVEVAQYKVQQQLDGHKPTLDIVAGYKQSSSESEITLEQQFKTGSVALQATLPLFSGFGVSAAVRQAKDLLRQAELELEQNTREIEQSVLDAYTKVRFGESQVAALDQALRSAEQAVFGTRKGVLAGTRNTVDVLNAEQQAAATRAKRIDAIYQLLEAIVELLVAVNKPPEEAIAWFTGQNG
ncbi:MAG: TolC family outer membrane protein [Methylohalobius sp.]|nr:TolC family outer membrane protein [Methylohalobius sp.]